MIRWGDILTKEGFLNKPAYAKSFNLVDRADFVSEEYKKLSNSDEPIPITYNQTQSAPHMDAIFVNYGEPSPSDIALEIGTGSGYLTAILSFLCRRVVSIEYISALSRWAYRNISKYGVKNVDLIIGNINRVPLKMKFDLIISTASFRKEPDFLKNLIKPEGRLIFPVGTSPPQRLIRYKNGKRDYLGSVAFVNIVD
ncbi:MAG: protein-L-isoaspartate O-methyltransferase [Thermoplasmatales archaeon]